MSDPTDVTETTERRIPAERGVVASRSASGGRALGTSFTAAADSSVGRFDRPAALTIRGHRFDWGRRTYVMGIVNATPDSFSGDGLFRAGSADARAGTAGTRDADAGVVERAVALARAMVADGADLLDIGGESSRPGHAPIDAEEEIRRVEPLVVAIRAALPEVPISVDTIKPSVAAAALDAGADLVNDVWGVADDDRLARVAAEHEAPIILTHNRAEARYRSLVAEVVADLQRAIERTVAAGVAWDRIIVDPGFGFGKAPEHNLALLRDLASLRLLARPILLGTSRKSTLGLVLDLPADERLEATLATTALGIAAGVDIVRVHDVLANVRAARMTDAVVRPERPGTAESDA